jgi:cytochrome c oxidase assembly protein subunit 15
VILLRRLAYATLTLAFAQIVFGAIVRITGSGMGCGDHWPKCNGQWFPSHDRVDLIIEITHRYIALGLTVAILALLVVTLSKRRMHRVGEQGGVLRPVALSAGLVVLAAVFGAVTVKMGLNPYVIVTHLAIAMSLLAVLVITVARSGGFGIETYSIRSDERTSRAVAWSENASQRTYRAAKAAAALAFLAIVLGALTANVAGANNSCQGFPGCRTILVHGVPLWIQVTHRTLAFLLFFHMLGMSIAAQRGDIPIILKRTTWIAFSTVLLQILAAAMLVELHLPAVLRSLHQAVGTLVWLSIFTLAVLSRYVMPRSVLK